MKTKTLILTILAFASTAYAEFAISRIEFGDLEGLSLAYATTYQDVLLLILNEPSGAQLLRSDGTTAGTYMLRVICPPSVTPDFRYYVPFNGKLYFTANSGTTGSVLSKYRLWQTDGTANGTRLAPELDSTLNHSIFSVIGFQGRLWFSADDGVHGREPWSTDGTLLGTQLFADLNPAGDGGFGGDAVIGNTLMFYAVTADVGGELRITDGTVAGTHLLLDINPATTSNGPLVQQFHYLGNRVIFSANDGTHGQELWVTDGTTLGTYMLGDFNPQDGADFSQNLDPQNFARLGEAYLFQGTTSQAGTELWRTDGTSEGTYLLKDIDPTTPPNILAIGFPTNLTTVGNLVFFIGNQPGMPDELWVSDGTETGTHLVKDIYPGSVNSSPNSFVAANGFLYFAANDPSFGYEVFRSDGTEEGTIRLTDVNPFGNSNPSPKGYTNGVIVSIAENAARTRELYALNVPPWVESFEAVGTSPTAAASVEFLVHFNEPVTGVDASDFQVLTENVVDATVSGVSSEENGKAWRVNVGTGLGAGTIRLHLLDDDSIVDTFAAGSLPLDGFGKLDGSFDANRGYTTDPLPPTATLDGPAEFSDNPVSLTLTFNRGVTDLAVDDFTVTNGTVTNITGGPVVYTVQVTPTANGQVTAIVVGGAAADYGAVPSAASNQWIGTYAGPNLITPDQDHNFVISLDELLRVIQFYNSGGFHCELGTEDGYAPGPGVTNCTVYTSDYNPMDWVIKLDELLRSIQFYNSGGYHPCPGNGTEDGFCPGA